MADYLTQRQAIVRIRRDLGLPVKPEVEALDGRQVTVRYLWTEESADTRYPNEAAWEIIKPENPPISWISDGDLKFLT